MMGTASIEIEVSEAVAEALESLDRVKSLFSEVVNVCSWDEQKAVSGIEEDIEKRKSIIFTAYSKQLPDKEDDY